MQNKCTRTEKSTFYEEIDKLIIKYSNSCFFNLTVNGRLVTVKIYKTKKIIKK